MTAKISLQRIVHSCGTFASGECAYDSHRLLILVTFVHCRSVLFAFEQRLWFLFTDDRMSNAQTSPPAVTSEKPSGESPSLLDTLLYGVSLPERLLRSAVGVTAGTAREIAEFVVPQAFQDSKSYEVAVRNSLNFLLTSIGSVAPSQPAATPDAAAVPVTTAPTNPVEATGTSTEAQQNDAGRFIAKKAVGNFIDIAGLTTLHVSPLWILAIVSDAAYGTRVYLKELADELQKQGLIDDSSTIHKVDDVFDAIRNASGKAASQFDQPPLSLDELKESLRQTRAALNEIDPKQLIPESELRSYWQQMKDLATSENVSLLGVSGALAMQTLDSIRNATQGTFAGLFVAGKIVNRNIFGHYMDSLGRIHKQGLWASVRNTYEPFVDLAWNNFTRSRKTWTEQVLHPSFFTMILRRIKGLFVRSQPK